MSKILLIILTAIVLILVLGFVILNVIDENDNINNNSNNKENNFSDIDNDGISDDNDDFPEDPSASIDSDGDGYPDKWNKGKNQKDSTKNLLLDKFPNDPSAAIDTDNDGFPDKWNQGKTQNDSTSIPPLKIDEYPNDPKAHQDTDGDGFADFYDKNDNVNLSITLEIQKFQLIQKVDLLPWGQIYFDVKIGEKQEVFKKNGIGWWTWLNKIEDVNLKIEYDIPDNTKEDYTTISISLFDYDLFKDDYELDINQNRYEVSIDLRFDNNKNTVDYEKINYGSDATLWIDITYPEEKADSEDFYDLSYIWDYKNKEYNLEIEISEDKYNEYLESNVDRIPQRSYYNHKENMRKFVTTNEPVIKEISQDLKSLSNENSFGAIEEADFVLKFVQKNIAYSHDNESKNSIEYWRFPVETLVEKTGDCEDTSVLYASILDNLGYDVALLFYSWEENDQSYGHLSVGVNLDGEYGDYVLYNNKKYYYCETTNDQLNVGEMPDEPVYIKEGADIVITI